MSEIETYEGQLSLASAGEGDDILFISTKDDPLAEVLQDRFDGKKVTVRYWITDKQCTKEQAEENTVKQVMGDLDADFGHAHSDYTGYLWTDEKLQIGGHDLLEELKGNIGKWLILEIEIH